MNKTIKVQANVNAQTVKNVNSILDKVGLTPTSAINALYHAIENQGQLPFQIGLTDCQKIEYGLGSNVDTLDSNAILRKMMHFVDELMRISEPEDWWDVARSILLMHGYLYWDQHEPMPFGQIATQLLKEYRSMTEEKFFNLVAKDLSRHVFRMVDAAKLSENSALKQALIWHNLLLHQLTDYYDSNTKSQNENFADDMYGLNDKQSTVARFVIPKIYSLLKSNIDQTEYFVENNML